MNYITDVRGARAFLRQKIDIIKVISDDIGLPDKTTGSDSFWFCPFHNETKGASFAAHIQLQVYKCFGCHVGGDVVSWVKNYYSMSMPEAIKTLANRYQIDISSYVRPPTPEEIYTNKCLDIYYHASNFVNATLLNDKDRLSWYKSDTGFDLDQIVTYGIGYSSSHNNLIEYVFSKVSNISQDDITKLELDNRLLWNNSLIYPIKDPYGRTRRFYAKPLTPPPDFGGKYVGTSSKNPLFTHSLLFGFDVVRENLRKNNFKVRLVEGFKAAIAANGVAVMGTKIHADQIQLLHDHDIKELIVGFDGDPSGRVASLHILDHISQFGDTKVYIAKMPDGTQPDDIIKTSGKPTLDDIFDKAVLPIQFFVEHKIPSGIPTTEEKFNILHDLKQHFSQIPDVYIDITADYLQNSLGIESESVRSYISELKLSNDELVNSDAEKTVLKEAISNKNSWSVIKQAIIDTKVFTNSTYEKIYSAIDKVHKKAREDDTTESINPQIIRDEIDVLFPRSLSLNTVVDEVLIYEDKYGFSIALKKVTDLYRRRTGINQARLMAAALQDVGKDTNEILSNYRKKLVSSIDVTRQESNSPIQLADSLMSELEERMMRKSSIVGFDFSTLKDVDGNVTPHLTALTMALSGIQPTHQTIISANSGVGKSLIALQMATSISICKDPEDQVPVLWIPLEMNATETTMRIVSLLSGVNNSSVQSGKFSDEEYGRIKKAADMIARGQLHIKKPRTGSIDEIFSIIDEYHFKYGIKAAFLDYIQLIADGPDDRGLSREQVIGKASKVMKNQVAEGMGIASICIAQQNRQNYKQGDPGKIESIGGSYQIAQDADDFFLLAEKTIEQMQIERDMGNRKCFIDKRRGGASDIAIDMFLDTSKFVNLRWTEVISPEKLILLSKGLS